MAQGQHNANLNDYLPVLAALAAGLYGYTSEDEDEDKVSRLLRAIGYGALAGVGTSMFTSSEPPQSHGVLFLQQPWIPSEGAAKLLGMLAGGFAGHIAAKYFLPDQVRADHSQIAALKGRIRAQEEFIKNRRAYMESVLKQKRKLPNWQRQYNAAAGKLENAARELERYKARLERMEGRGRMKGSAVRAAAPVLGALLGGLASW